MQITINGESREVAAGVTVAALLDELDLSGQRLAVELNQEIVPRSTFAEQILQAGDQVEIVRAIGGG